MSEFGRLWGYFWRYRGRFFAAVACSLVVALCTMAFTSLIIPIYETYRPAEAAVPEAAGADKEHVLSLLQRSTDLDVLGSLRERAFVEVPLIIICLFIIKGIFAFLSFYLMDYIGLKAILDLRHELYRRITHQAMSFFSSLQTGELISRVTNDINRLQGTLARQFAELVQFSLILVGQVAWMIYCDWELSIVCGVILPLAVYPVLRFGRRLKKVSRRSQEAMAEVSDRLHETVSGARVVTCFNMQQHEVDRFGDALQRMFRVDVKGIKVLALSSPVVELVGAVGAAVLVWYAGSRISSGALNPGVLMSFLAALGWTYLIFKRLGRNYHTIQQALAAARRVFDLMDRDVTVRDRLQAPPLPGFEREIRFNDVSFAYDDRTILDRVDLTVPRGQVLAIVGSSGAGKTTLVNLIPRLYDVTSGSMEIDGRDVREFSLESLRDRIAIVTQEILLFSDTVGQNIAYGRPGATAEAIERAARSALAHEFIGRLPRGYDTPIGERGHFLSVGQRQRIAIARALLRDAEILILDEATSALDAESEALVQEALANLMRGRTVFVIAHRLSTVRHADRIIVMDGGRIVEQGTHDELLGSGGIYDKLHSLQFRDVEQPSALPG